MEMLETGLIYSYWMDEISSKNSDGARVVTDISQLNVDILWQFCTFHTAVGSLNFYKMKVNQVLCQFLCSC